MIHPWLIAFPNLITRKELFIVSIVIVHVSVSIVWFCDVNWLVRNIMVPGFPLPMGMYVPVLIGTTFEGPVLYSIVRFTPRWKATTSMRGLFVLTILSFWTGPFYYLPAAFLWILTLHTIQSLKGKHFSRDLSYLVLISNSITLTVFCFTIMFPLASLLGDGPRLIFGWQTIMVFFYMLIKATAARATTTWCSPGLLLPIVIVSDYFVR